MGLFSKAIPKAIVKIQQIGARYVIDVGDSRIHVINENSLRWNLKHFGIKPDAVADAFDVLNLGGVLQFELEDVA